MKKLNVLLFTSALLAVCANAGFEDFETGGAEGATFTNWEGDGYITNTAVTCTYGVPGGQTPSANAKALAIEGSVTNGSLFTAMNSATAVAQVDMMVKVVYPDEALALPSGETDVQIAVGVNTNGELNVYCAPKTGSGTAAFVPVSAALTAGEWKRVSFNFDYTSKFCEVLIDGLPCVSEYGALSPALADRETAGAWYKLAKDDATKLSSMKVVGTTAIDDVYTGQSTTDNPFAIPDSAVVAATDGTNVKRSWLAKQGVNDTDAAAVDGTGMKVSEKYLAGLDVNDGIKFELKDLQPSTSDASKMVFTFPGTTANGTTFQLVGSTNPNSGFEVINGATIAAGEGKLSTATVSISTLTTGVKYFKVQAVQ